jgi:TPR repeat protein
VQDWEEAVKLFRQAAAQGLALAQNSLSACYFNGTGVARDHEAAVRLFAQAAAQGYAVAQYHYGHCCMLGAGVAHDFADAARNFRLAADQGDAMAQYWCGYLSECGQGAKRDMAEAVRLYRAAAAQGDVRALARLGVCLEKGRRVAQSEAEAAARYAEASELGGAATLFEYGAANLDAIGERSAPEAFTLQLAVSDLALAARLEHAGAAEKLAPVASRRELVSACCLGCGATRVLRLCTRCRVAKFCDGECTRRIWPVHRPVCTQWQDDARAAPTEE